MVNMFVLLVAAMLQQCEGEGTSKRARKLEGRRQIAGALEDNVATDFDFCCGSSGPPK